MNTVTDVVERVKRQGMFQRLRFKLVTEDTPLGRVKLLRCEKNIDLAEAIRIAEKHNLPVRAGNMKVVLPPGRTLNGFLVKNE